MNKNIVLVGNPNTGKTTFFNTISKSNEHVGNWHGVTVDIKQKNILVNNNSVIICDLPGLYSLTNYSYEEEVAKTYIYNHNDVIINICDANNLSRNLYLTLELLELKKQVVLCINMKREFLKSKRKIDIEKLNKILGIPIFFIDANNKNEVKKVVEFALSYKADDFKRLPYVKLFNIEYLNNQTNHFVDQEDKNKTFYLTKLLEKDDFVLNKLKINKDANKLKVYNNLCNNYDFSKIYKIRYDFIDEISKQVIINQNNFVYGKSKLDKILLNKYLCFPCFFLILCFIFYLTFSSIGSALTNALSCFIENIFSQPLSTFVQKSTNNQFIISFVNDALISGFTSILNFLPQVVLLFLFLNILEDSGYLSRLAFVLEDFFAKIGLSGKSVFSLLMGFGCSTTASLTSRNMEDKNSKIKTAILTPYLSCSAKLPLYSTICTAFFAKNKVFVIFMLYLLGVVMAIAISYFLEKTFLKSGEQSFILEFPPYRIPNFKRTINNIFINAKQFIIRVGSVMLCFTIVIWFMQNCNFKFQFGKENTMLKCIGTFIAPIFKPLGFGSWGVVCSLLCGVVAKEIIVSTMSIINNVNIDSSVTLSQSLLIPTSVICFSKASALSYLVFSLLYLPCISTIAVFCKEIGIKWTLTGCLIQLTVAYVTTFVIYKIYNYFINYGIIAGVLSLMIFIVISIAFMITKKVLNNKRKKCVGVCKACSYASKCK